MKRRQSSIGFHDLGLGLGFSLGIVGFEEDYGSQENSEWEHDGPGQGHGYGYASEQEDSDSDGVPF